MFNPFVKIGSQVKGNPANTVFLIHLPDLFLDIDQGIICDLKQFRMFPKPFDVSGSNFFSVTYPQLGIIDWIFYCFCYKRASFHHHRNQYIIVYNIYNKK